MSRPSRPLEPGATVGVLGSGQLGRMLALAARPMGYRVHVYSPEADSPAGRVADHETAAPYLDLDAVGRFAAAVDAVTFEFENVPAATARAVGRSVPVRPAHRVLETTQNRLREKGFLAAAGFPVTPFEPVADRAALAAALDRLGAPAVLKTAGWGYDGKGQTTIEASADAAAALARLADSAPDRVPESASGELAEAPWILERKIDFEREVSVVAARGLDGSAAHWGVIENRHRDHILDVSVAPAPVADEVSRRALDIAHGVLEALDVVGVLCVEMFVTRDGELLINELAPRPHNSGHLTVDAAVTSQFEQQLRAVCGLPLGSTELLRPAAMANLMGDLWRGGEPPWHRALEVPGVKLHLYGKRTPRAGRKMGHLTALAATPAEALERVLEARRALTGASATPAHVPATADAPR